MPPDTSNKMNNLKRRLKNRTKQYYRARQTVFKYQHKLKLQKDSARKRQSRAASALKREMKKAEEIRKTHSFKTKRQIDLRTREMLRDLVVLNVPDSSINEVVKTVATWLGVIVTDKVSVRAIGRVVQEAGIAAKIQLADEITKSGGTHYIHLVPAEPKPSLQS